LQGQLGQGTSRKALSAPARVDLSGCNPEAAGGREDDDTRIAQVGASGYYSAALSRNGRVYTFGQMTVSDDQQPSAPDAGVAVLVRKFANARVSSS
jgi:hypothetical protein